METKTADTEQQQQKIRIQIVANGPALIQGSVVITDQHGRKEEKNNLFALCRCGGSHSRPYCDGTHNYNGFTD